MKRVKITGDKGIYHKESNTLAVLGRTVTVYKMDEPDVFRPIFRSKDIRHPACMCFTHAADSLWVATTENLIYLISLENGDCLKKLCAKVQDKPSYFEIMSMALSLNEKWIYLRGYSSDGALTLAYDIETESVKAIDFDHSMEVPIPQACYHGNTQQTVMLSEDDLAYKEDWFIRQEKRTYLLDEETCFETRHTEINPFWKFKIRFIIGVSDDGRYLLCETSRRFKIKTAVIDIWEGRILEGDVVSGEEGCYDRGRNRFVLHTLDEVFVVQIQNQSIRCKSIFKSQKKEIRGIVLLDDKILAFGEGISYLIRVEDVPQE